MSDSNLKNDEFFHNLLKKSEDRMISINILNKCKRIKDLNVSEEDIIKAIKKSSYLKIDEEKKMFGRVN